VTAPNQIDRANRALDTLNACYRDGRLDAAEFRRMRGLVLDDLHFIDRPDAEEDQTVVRERKREGATRPPLPAGTRRRPPILLWCAIGVAALALVTMARR
jgi:hypothetical protein